MATFMYGIVRGRPGFKIADQIEALEAYADSELLRIFEFRKSSDLTMDDALLAFRPGNVVLVYRLVCLVPPKPELGKTAPRTFLKDVLRKLVEKKVKVIEVQTGRTCSNAEDAALAVADAFTDLSGYKRQKAGPGRPPAKPLEEVERLRLLGLWKSNDFDTNAAAVAAMGKGWTVSKAIKTFGPSGRVTGRRKLKT